MKLQEICQGRETRGGHQQDREKETENAFVCRLGWLTWLENNNRPPFSLTSPLPWFIGYNIIDSHWRRIWNTCLACCYCLCLHSTFTARRVLFFVYSLPCCKPLLLFQLAPVVFFSPHTRRWGKGEPHCLGDLERLGVMQVTTFCMMQETDSSLLPANSFQRAWLVFLPCCFCLHSVPKLRGRRRTNFHTWHRTPKRRS